jgi:hypothetical protein
MGFSRSAAKNPTLDEYWAEFEPQLSASHWPNSILQFALYRELATHSFPRPPSGILHTGNALLNLHAPNASFLRPD